VGQTEGTGRYNGLIRKNGEDYVIDFTCVESHRLSIRRKSSSSA
jgi:hypothetical protein